MSIAEIPQPSGADHASEAAFNPVNKPKKSHPLRNHVLAGLTRVGLATYVAAVGVGVPYEAYLHRYKILEEMADAGRATIGADATTKIESYGYKVNDRVDRLKNDILGTEPENPFNNTTQTVLTINQAVATPTATPESAATPTPEPIIIPPERFRAIVPPETKTIIPNPIPHEAEWTFEGLPQLTADTPLMARTFIHPDGARPNAVVGALLMDHRLIRLHMVGGTVEPGTDKKGPGVIAPEDIGNLLVAWNGGFKGGDGSFGMIADGKTYRPLRDGLATIAVDTSGQVQIGQMGRDIVASDDLVGVRQNGVLLVHKCVVTTEAEQRASDRSNGNFAFLNTKDSFANRSGVGITASGDIIWVGGINVSANTLGAALQALGACEAMGLDMNTPFVGATVYYPQPDGAPKKAIRFMNETDPNPERFISPTRQTAQPQERDFAYWTLNTPVDRGENVYIP